MPRQAEILAPKNETEVYQAIPAPREPTVLEIIQVAVQEKLPAAELERLLALYHTEKAHVAAAKYAAAVAAFKRACPPIKKTKVIEYPTSRGVTKIPFADLAEIARTVDPLLEANGLFYYWGNTTFDDKGRITVTCILKHVNGHSEPASVAFPTESPNQGMSPAQKVAAADTFARRYALIHVLGLTTTDTDTDSASAGIVTGSSCTYDQVAQLEQLIEETKSNRDQFLKWGKVERMEDFPAARYDQAVRILEGRLKERRQ